VEQAAGHGHSHQCRDLRPAARLAEQHHAARIAAEFSDVVPDPAQGHHRVQHACVAGVGELRTPEPRQVQIAERVQPMIDGDDDDISAMTQARSVIQGGRPARQAGDLTGLGPHSSMLALPEAPRGLPQMIGSLRSAARNLRGSDERRKKRD
jgi:hypothetical protein